MFTSIRLNGLLAVLLSFVYLATDIQRQPDFYDEGIILYGAERLARGIWPYKDFWTIYPIGQFQVLAWVFELFGHSIIVARIYDLLIKAALAGMVFMLASSFTSRAWAWLAWTLACLWLERAGLFLYPIFPALLCVLLAIGCMSSKSGNAWLGGILLGLCSLFRIDIACYAVLAGASSGLQARKSITSFIVGAGLFAVPVYLLIGWKVSFFNLFDQLVYFPLFEFSKVRSLAGPWQTEILKTDITILASNAFPFIVLAWAIIYGVLNWRKPEFPGSIKPAYIGLTILGLALINQARVRTDFQHIFPLYLPTIILFTFLVYQAMLRKPAILSKTLAVACLIPMLGIPLKAKLVSLAGSNQILTTQNPRAQNVRLPQDQLEVARFLQSKLGPTEAFLSAVPNLQDISRNDVLIYFLADRPSATYFHELHPGAANSPQAERSIISELKNKSVRYIVIFAPGNSDLSSDGKIAKFILKEYSRQSRIGNYLIYEKL